MQPECRLWYYAKRGDWCVVWSGISGTKRVSTGCRDYNAGKPPLAARQYLEQFIAGTMSPNPPAVLTINAILERYLAERKGKVRSHGTLKDAATHLKAGIGLLEPSHLTKSVIERYVKKRLASTVERTGRPYSNGTVIKEIVTLRAALRLAEAEQWIPRAPIIPMPISAPPPRDRWITKAEALDLIAGCEADHIRLYVLLGLHTLARHQAIVSLRWEGVDLEQGIIDFGSGHGNKRRSVVPITPQLHKALTEALEAAQTDYVVEFRDSPVKSIKTGFKAACKRAKLAQVTPHTLRHTGATWMALAGVPMADIARYLGDSIVTAERVYAKFHPDYLRKAANALAF